MPKVIGFSPPPSPPPTAHPKVTCGNCRAVVAYEAWELRIAGHGPNESGYINCPNCNLEITLY